MKPRPLGVDTERSWIRHADLGSISCHQQGEHPGILNSCGQEPGKQSASIHQRTPRSKLFSSHPSVHPPLSPQLPEVSWPMETSRNLFSSSGSFSFLICMGTWRYRHVVHSLSQKTTAARKIVKARLKTGKHHHMPSNYFL